MPKNEGYLRIFQNKNLSTYQNLTNTIKNEDNKEPNSTTSSCYYVKCSIEKIKG